MPEHAARRSASAVPALRRAFSPPPRRGGTASQHAFSEARRALPPPKPTDRRDDVMYRREKDALSLRAAAGVFAELRGNATHEMAFHV